MESNHMLNEFVANFKDKTCYQIVEPALMELAKPSIRDAFSLCVPTRGKTDYCMPLFLFPRRHWYQDIHCLTAEVAKEHDGVPYIIIAPLGLHHLLVNVVNDRINYCLKHVAREAVECAACVGTRNLLTLLAYAIKES